MLVRKLLPGAALLALAMNARAQTAPVKDCGVTSLQVCALHILQDEAYILASPVRARPIDLLWIAPFGAATGIAIDQDARVMRNLGHDPSRESTFDNISNAGVYGAIAATGVGYAASSVTHDDHLREASVLAGEAMIDATLLDQGLKYAINRQYPNQGDETGRFWPHGLKTWPDGASMPSEHSINIWAFAHVVAGEYPSWRTRVLVYSLATTVSASRVIARQHFPSDVIVGSTFGYLIGGFVLRHRASGSDGLSLSAVQTENGKGVQLAYNFGGSR